MPGALNGDTAVAPVVRSPSMKEVVRTLQAVARRDISVTFVGENGSGKEVLARRLHELSPRSKGPFIPINCAAIPEALFESELFGHERGAFTGAVERARGKVEAANQGTLFLDEVGEMSLPMQAKLLCFIENRRYMRVGGSVKLDADTLQHFVSEFAKKHSVSPPRFSRAARVALLAHPWPPRGDRPSTWLAPVSPHLGTSPHRSAAPNGSSTPVRYTLLHIGLDWICCPT